MNFTDTITMYSSYPTSDDDHYWERFVIKGCQWREKIVRTTDSSGKVFKTKEISVTIPINGDMKNRLFFDTKGKDIIVLGECPMINVSNREFENIKRTTLFSQFARLPTTRAEIGLNIGGLHHNGAQNQRCKS